MNAPASFKNPFFITRRSANLMEDLHRQISSAGAVCLVYGVEGVGKSRLIRQFISTRLGGRKVKFCRLSTDGFYLNEDSRLHAFENLMPTILDTPSSNSIWVIDQLELSSEEFLQQLLKFWLQHASKLSCALVLACRPERLGMVFKISEHLTLKVPSVELKPLSKTESFQYISTQLCPNLDSVAVLPSEVSRAINRANGVPGQLNQIIQQYSGLVECTRKKKKKRKVIPLLIMAVALLGITTVIYINTDNLNFIDRPVIHQTNTNQYPRETVNQPQDSVIPRLVEPVILVEDQLVIEQKEPIASVDTETADIPVQKQEAIVDKQPDIVDTETEKEVKTQNLLRERLTATEKWLQQASDQTASIQIMSLLIGLEPQKSLIRFFHNLEAKGINLQQIYVYRMNKGGDPIYVVLFGSYIDRAEARANIKALPSSLKANGPIVRTVGGIKKEIEAGKK